jgi:heme ABC exporter ATP-binding subunit CcmA/heme exporter protein CcmB
LIELHAVSKVFGPHRALDGVGLHVAPGAFVLLVGPNGAGKTTLLRILATLTRPSAGTVRVAGLDPAQAGATVRRQIGHLSHRTLLYDDLTAEQNLAFYARLYAVPAASDRIADMLARVGLAARRHDRVSTFSRGMQQRLAVARALLHGPRLLLLDEPYSGLDPQAADALTALLGELHGEGCTLLLATHALDHVTRLRQRTVVLDRGRVIDDTRADATFPARYRERVGKAADRQSEKSAKRQISKAADRQSGRLAKRQSGEVAGSENPKSKVQSPKSTPVFAIVGKDLAAEWHTREMLNAMFVFAVLALLVFSFALDLRGAVARAAAPGVLWVTIAFAGTLGLSRSMAREQRNGGIEGLLLAPVPRAAIFFGKALGNLALMLAVEAVLLPLAVVLFDVALLRPGVLLTMLLGTVGYAAVGTLLAAIAVNTRAREVMLPILLLPLLVPLLLAAVQTTRGLLEGATWPELSAWTQLLVAYDLVMVAVAMVTFAYVVES